MKRWILLVLVALLMLCCATSALAAKAGDTVTVRISVTSNPKSACAGGITISYDKNVLEFVSAQMSSDALTPITASNNSFSLLDLSGISTGAKATITFKVTSNAVPGKTYSVSASGRGFVDIDEKPVSVSVSGGTVKIDEAGCTNHKWDEGKVTREATCAKEGVKTFTCTNAGCTATKTESIPKLTTHSYDDGKVTKQPTCTADGVKTFTCTVCKTTKTEKIPATGHDDGKWVTVREATCKGDGLKKLRCTKCDAVLDSQSISSEGIAHTPGQMIVTTKATCTEAGEKTQKCTVCEKVLATEPIPAEGHDEGEWVVVTEATCTEAGVKELRCTKCQTVLDTQSIPAEGHDDGEWVVVTEATCTEAGVKELRCTKCQTVLDTQSIPAEGHDDGEWVVAKAATCKEDGLRELRCTKCQTVLNSEVIPAANVDHKPGKMVVTTKPTCTETGEKTQKCTVCDAVIAAEEIPATGHDKGKWVVVKKATRNETGLRELRCKKCATVLKTEEIPVVTTTYYSNRTVCSFGPRFSDEGIRTKEWYRFTPVDLSVDGTQTYDLIAYDRYIVGQVVLTVADGTVTVECNYVSEWVQVRQEFLTFLHSIEETESLEPEKLMGYSFGEPISIEGDLNGDTKLLLYINNVINFNSDMPIRRIYPDTDWFKNKVEKLKVNMD